MPNVRSKDKKCKTITLSEKLAIKIQDIANKKTDGDFSAVVREALENYYKNKK